MKRDLYAILGVSIEADAETIKRAYRRLAMRMHPDTGSEPDPARFREVHDAYVALSEQARRRVGETPLGHVETGRVARRAGPIEEIRAGGPIRVMEDFDTMAPSMGEILDHIAQNFFGFHQKSGGPQRRLELEIVLSPAEAAAGGRLPLQVPCYETCRHCEGRIWMWGVCPQCHGYGMVETSRVVELELAPGIRSGARLELPLRAAGIGNLLLEVTVLVV